MKKNVISLLWKFKTTMKNLHLLPTENSSRLVKIYNDVNRETFT